MMANVQAIQNRQSDASALQRYDETACILLGDASAKAADGVRWIKQLCVDLRIPPLGSYGITLKDLDVLVQKASAASSMKPNPVELTPEELTSILASAL